MKMGKLDGRYFPLLLDVIEQSIFTVDEDRRITFFNHAAEKTTGYAATDVVGRKCSDVFRTEICEAGCPLRATIQSGRRIIDRRVRISTKDGRSIPVSVTTAALTTGEGETLGGVEVITDLSSLVHLQRQLDGRYCFEDILSRNAKMQEIFELLPLVAQSDSTVMVLGPSGTGKELMAKAVHHQSGRRDRPFVAVNCAAMPENLMESELFGYVRGAFTDAKRDKPGRIAQADGGTLFLDEVGDLPLAIQVKLLRFLQERTYEPLGATFSTRANVRVISATNQDLEAMVGSGAFRQDLYFRLNVMQITLPPLKERADDIPLLVQHFIQRFRTMTGNKIEGIDHPALECLMNHDFPGNVRELENIVERAFILCRGPLITCKHLPANILDGPCEPEPRGTTIAKPRARKPKLDPLHQAERSAIIDVLKRNEGNRSWAAAELGIHRTTLIRKIKKYGIS